MLACLAPAKMQEPLAPLLSREGSFPQINRLLKQNNKKCQNKINLYLKKI